MSLSNPTAATQGRGFDLLTRPNSGRTTRRVRAPFTLAALVAASLGSTGCRSFETVAECGSAARMIAVVEATQEHPADPYAAPADGEVLLAGTR